MHSAIAAEKIQPHKLCKFTKVAENPATEKSWYWMLLRLKIQPLKLWKFTKVAENPATEKCGPVAAENSAAQTLKIY